ncbi:hypothetical protein LF95_15780 [Thalassospira sp. TSL5-1]|nr:hypothetical protein LF95_15780 [Thalassospira sp. TSL5-1]
MPVAIQNAIDHAVSQIAPAWPLENTVAVNPFVGQANMRLAQVANLHQRLAGTDILMPVNWYQTKISTGEITTEALQQALKAAPYPDKPASVANLIDSLANTQAAPTKIKTLAESAALATRTDWPTIINDCIGRWAACHFDQGGALWKGGFTTQSAWKSWQAWASNDKTAEILGLIDFCATIGDLPEDGRAAIDLIVGILNPSHAGLANQFHQALLSINGWAQHARHLRWTAELDGRSDDTIVDLLAMRLSWDLALHQAFQSHLDTVWQETLDALAQPASPSMLNIVREIAQTAYENSLQHSLAEHIATNASAKPAQQAPFIQAAFCIDVRSEVFRRAFESLSPDIQTLGFAGFFGLPVAHQGVHSALCEHRLPVLLAPGLEATTGKAAKSDAVMNELTDKTIRPRHQFKTAALTSFAYVDAIGPAYLWKLAKQTLGFGSGKKTSAKSLKPAFKTSLDENSKCDIAEKVLRAMSFTKNFARIVLLAGHGANVTNNPHKSALHCGACGGHAGDVNARLLAGLLNEQGVRDGLEQRGISIPGNTVFIAGLHDTTTDAMTLFDQDIDRPTDNAALAKLRDLLAQAGSLARSERAARLPGADNAKDVMARATNWSETRPEWGLAGCKYFIAAPRSISASANLKGESFLHDYDYRADAQNGFTVLELILTAPVVVASWISLQYYASTVAPELYGAGNKLLHNVVGGIGVYEGNGGQLRTGLPIQSVHNGNTFMHDPARLTVCIDAPIDAINTVLEKHPAVRALFDNGWLHLLAFNSRGKLAHRYLGACAWQDISAPDPSTPNG